VCIFMKCCSHLISRKPVRKMNLNKLRNIQVDLLHGAACALSLCCHTLVLFHRLLHEHIQRLIKVVTANHKALQIPEVFSP